MRKVSAVKSNSRPKYFLGGKSHSSPRNSKCAKYQPWNPTLGQNIFWGEIKMRKVSAVKWQFPPQKKWSVINSKAKCAKYQPGKMIGEKFQSKILKIWLSPGRQKWSVKNSKAKCLKPRLGISTCFDGPKIHGLRVFRPQEQLTTSTASLGNDV